VGFVVDKAALGQVFSEYFGFPCQSINFSIIKITQGWHNRPIRGRSAEWTHHQLYCGRPNLLQPRKHYFPFSDLGKAIDLLKRESCIGFYIRTNANDISHLVSLMAFGPNGFLKPGLK
jgi:hypothetical protein